MTNGKQELEETMEVQFQPVFDKQTVPEGRAGHRAGGKETESTGQFRVPSRGSVRRREDGGRGTSNSIGRSERMESS